MPSNNHALRFAYSTINWGTRGDPVSMFSEIREAGWQAVELFDHSLDWLGPPATLKSTLGDLQSATFFGSLSIPIDRQMQYIHKQRIDYAALFGTEAYGLVGGGRLRQRPPTAAEYTELAAACEELAVYGADKGVVVAYHPHVACTIETEEEIDILLNETKLMQLCLDISHIGLVDEDPVAHLRKYKERLGYVHMKDWAAGKFVELGEGSINLDFVAFLNELIAQKFPGWVVIEQSVSDVSPLQSAKINAKYLTDRKYVLDLPEEVKS